MYVISDKLRLNKYCIYFFQITLILIILIFSLDLHKRNLYVPFNYHGDALVQMLYIKNILTNGWVFHTQNLSSPFGMNPVAFPLNINFDWLIMKFLGLFFNEPGVIINIYWLLSILFSAIFCLYALNSLGLNKYLSFLLGILYAFLPYTFVRSILHINTLYHFVPLLCLLAIKIATDLDFIKKNLWLYNILIIQGFSFIYNSFFTLLLFLFSISYGYLKLKSRESIKYGLIAIIILSSATIINQLPTIYSWHKHGKLDLSLTRLKIEVEVYGAKIRRMLAPHENNPLPILRTWGQRDIKTPFPLENENRTVRLGIIGSIGFIILLLTSLGLISPQNDRTKYTITVISGLSLFTLLYITIGGFGSLFNLLITSEIRSINRFSVFISFFSFASLGLYFQEFWAKKRNSFLFIICFIMFVLIYLISLYDQLLDANYYKVNRSYQHFSKEYNEEKELVKKLELLYPNGATILQMPLIYQRFPLEHLQGKMLYYDHLRLFLWANGKFKWSYPNSSVKSNILTMKLSKLAYKEFVSAAIFSGYNLIIIDKYGYNDDAKSLIKDFRELGVKYIIESERYCLLDMNDFKQKLIAELGEESFKKKQKEWTDITLYRESFFELLPLVLINYNELIDFSDKGNGFPYLVKGWSYPEAWGTWSEAEHAKLLFKLPQIPSTDLLLHLNGNAFVTEKNPLQEIIVKVNNEYLDTIRLTIFNFSTSLKIPQNIASKKNNIIIMEFHIKTQKSPYELGLGSDNRKLGFGLISLKIEKIQ